MIKLSIIVPVYNVEPYIRPCFESIFNQGLDDNEYEVIIINDGSTDRSMEMIADMICQHNNITVINQENLSLSVARNNGIAAAKGEYILMPDSDDLLIENSIPLLLETAIEKKVDLIVADFLSMNTNIIDMLNNNRPTQKEFKIMPKTGHELFVEDLKPYECYVWRTMYRRQFLLENKLRFIPGINYQDIPFTHECYLKANKCIRASWLLYIYREARPGAATTYFTLKKSRSYCIAIAETWKLRQMNSLSSEIIYKIEEDVFFSFCKMIYHTLSCIKTKSERNEIIDFLTTKAPNLNFTHNIRQKATTFMIKKTPHLFINLYYLYSKLFY